MHTYLYSQSKFNLHLFPARITFSALLISSARSLKNKHKFNYKGFEVHSVRKWRSEKKKKEENGRWREYRTDAAGPRNLAPKIVPRPGVHFSLLPSHSRFAVLEPLPRETELAFYLRTRRSKLFARRVRSSVTQGTKPYEGVFILRKENSSL